MSPVGDGGAQVGQVHRGSQDFSLADGKGNHRGGIPPSAAVCPVVRARRGDAAGELRREVAPQFASETKTLHILVPMVQAVGHGVIFAVIDNIFEHVAIVGVAGHHEAFLHVDGRAVPVAAQLVPGAVMVAMRARVAHFRSKDALFQADERIHQLEHRARRVGRLHGAVVHGLVRVLDNLVVVLADIGQLFHVDAGRRHQGQDFAGGGFYRHHRAHLAGHEFLPVLLELRVDGGGDVLARNGFLVHGAVFIRLLNLVAGVAEVDVVAFLAAEVLLAGRFDTCHAGIVAAVVFAWMKLHITLVHL